MLFLNRNTHTNCESYTASNLSDVVITASSKCVSFVSRHSSYSSRSSGRHGVHCVAAVQRKRWKELWWKQVFPWGVVIGQGRGEFRLAFVLLVMGDESRGAGPVATAFYYWSETDQGAVARGCPLFYFLSFPFFASTLTTERQMFLKW